MGAYAEYLDRGMDFLQQQAERKRQLARISAARSGRDVLVYAGDLTKGQVASMEYSDILPFKDQLANLSGSALDIIVETPGGFAEVAEDIIHLVRPRYERVGIIVPGWAKSAGTIFAMAGDEILMGEGSALGPIDAQILHSNNKRFSAHAFLEGLNKIKEEVAETKRLNPAYIPILQNISPGEIQHCLNAQEFSASLVRDWLERFKFKYWEMRETSGEPVTAEYKKARAREIAGKLCDQSRWLTHGRSIRIRELEGELNLKIVNYSKIPDLNDAINRYYTLLRMAFETNLFKVFETPVSQIYRFTGMLAVQRKEQEPDIATVELSCPKCKRKLNVQANLGRKAPLQPGAIPYPVENDVLKCPQCGTENNLAGLKLKLEGQSGKKIA